MAILTSEIPAMRRCTTTGWSKLERWTRTNRGCMQQNRNPTRTKLRPYPSPDYRPGVCTLLGNSRSAEHSSRETRKIVETGSTTARIKSTGAQGGIGSDGIVPTAPHTMLLGGWDPQPDPHPRLERCDARCLRTNRKPAEARTAPLDRMPHWCTGALVTV
jgi:hypothetical protein